MSGALLSKLFGNPERDARAFEMKTEALSRTHVKAALYGRIFATLLVLSATLATALAYGWGGVLASRHALELGTVVAIAALLARLYAPLMGLSNVQVSVIKAIAMQVKELNKLGVRQEICAIATKAFKVPNETVLPGLTLVGDGFISLIGWQTQGYKLVPLF